ncbi:MAG: Ig-like domain-containing protein [Planctomycetota bacterium]
MSRTLRSFAAPLALSALIVACSSSDDDNDGPPQTATVQGTVVNAPNAVSGVRIVLTGPGGTYRATTTANGTYDLSGVPTGTYTVDVYGDDVYDSDGNPIPDKIDLRLAGVFVQEGTASINGRPIFLPERAAGTEIDVATGTTGTIAAGTVIENQGEGIALSFDVATEATFRSADDTTISITPIPVDQIPRPLPQGLTAALAFSIEPAGATFDVRPGLSLPNEVNLPTGTGSVSLRRLTFDTGEWVEFGTGTVTADGTRIVADASSGPPQTGLFAVAVAPFCTTTVTGRVEGEMNEPLVGVQVTTIGGRTAMTDADGLFSISNVQVPSASFPVVATAVPGVNSGHSPAESGMEMAQCGGATNVGTIELPELAIDAQLPTIVSTTPVNEATDVADNVALSAVFSEVISPGSINSSTVLVRANGEEIAGDIGATNSSDMTTISFVPRALLPLEASCEFVLDANLMDAAGNRLGETTTITFTTAAATSGGAAAIDVTPDAPSALDAGNTLQLTATVTDAAGATVTGALVDWSSSDSSILRVDATGLVTAIRAGSADISGSFGAIADSVSVSVNVPAVDAVTILGGESNVVVGSSFVLFAAALDSGANRLNGVSFNWTSDAEAVATVDASGTVRAIGAGGPATITATDPVSGESADFAVTVISPDVTTQVTIDAPITMIGTGTSVQYSATAFDAMQTVVTGVTFAWTTSNAAVATVSPSGLVTGRGVGTATITATANGSNQVSGTAEVTGFSDSPLVITVLGGNDGITGVPNLRVLRHDASTGEFLDELTTDANGVANFGLTNAERASVTVLRDPYQFKTLTYLRSVLDVPVGPLTISYDEARQLARLDVTASGPSGTNAASVLSGGWEANDIRFGGSKSSTVSVFGVRPRFEQPNDLVSFIVLGYGSLATRGIIFNDPTGDPPTSAAFLLDQDPDMIDDTNVPVTLDEANLTAIPYTAQRAVSPADVTILRDGLIFGIDNGSSDPSMTGNSIAAIPPGTDAVTFGFEAPALQSPATVERTLAFTDTPAALELAVPAMDLMPATFDEQTNTISWTASGNDAANLDVGVMELTSEFLFQGGPESRGWDLTFDGTRSSIGLPELPKDLSNLDPYIPSTSISMRLSDLSGITGYEAFLSAARPHATRVERVRMVTRANESAVTIEQLPIEIFISGQGTGTVTVDWGSGQVQMTSDQVVQVPRGSEVTITATADGQFVVDSFFSSGGPATGVGTSTASITFTVDSAGFAEIEFE